MAEYGGVPDQKGLDPRRVSPMALVALSNRIRPAAPKTFRYFAEQGVAVKVISGDNPVTVSEVARQAGIEGAEKYVDAATLRSDEDIARAVREYTVFGRVTPNQKRKLVRALQRQGHTVAMTGDGVNDVLALKDADCGIAMASGSDAACHAAQLVLLNSDFSAMPKVVAEGRRVINNIQRAAALYLVKNIFSFLLALISLFATFPYPVTPLQLSLLSAVTIGVPSFFLALEPNHSLVKGKFLSNVFRAALPGGLTDLFVVLGVEVFFLTFGFSEAELSTMSAILLIVIGIMVLYEVCKPFDWKRRVLWGAMAGSSAVTILGFGGSFGLSPLGTQAFLVLLVFLGLAYSIMRFMLGLFDQGERLLNRGRHRGKEVTHAHSPLPQLRLPGLGGAVLSNGSRRQRPGLQPRAARRLGGWPGGAGRLGRLLPRPRHPGGGGGRRDRRLCRSRAGRLPGPPLCPQGLAGEGGGLRPLRRPPRRPHHPCLHHRPALL